MQIPVQTLERDTDASFRPLLFYFIYKCICVRVNLSLLSILLSACMK